jgi:hypothetical protein
MVVRSPMKKQKSNFVFKILVVFFLLAYVTGSIANMVLIPRYVPKYDQTAASPVMTIHRRPQSGDFGATNFLQIFDKSTFDNNLTDRLNFEPKSFNLPMCSEAFVAGLHYSHSPKSQPYNFRYAYLSLCTFRI